MSPTPKHIIFICTGNTCRSPMAEGLFRHHIGNRDHITVGSAGIAASKGTPANEETIATLKKLGISLDSFASRPVTDALLAQATHVFAMTRGHLDTLEAHFPLYSEKYFLLREFAGPPDKHNISDIPDPIGMGRKAYEETAAILQAAIPSVIAYIDSTGTP